MTERKALGRERTYFMENKRSYTDKETVTLWDILKLLAGKIKIIILVALVAAILGGAFGGFMAYRGVTYYAEIGLSVSPVDDSDNLIYTLKSERFIEKLLFEENGLPAKEDCNPEDYDKALKALEEYEEARESRNEKYDQYTQYYIQDVEQEYNMLKTKYDQIFNVLKLYKEAAVEEFAKDEGHKKMIADYEARLLAAENEKNEYYDNEYAPKKMRQTELEIQLAQANDVMNEKRRAADEALENLLVSWRKIEDVRSKVLEISSCVSYEYSTLNENAANKTSKEEPNKGHISIMISVPDDEALAEMITERYVLRLEDIVVEYLERAADASAKADSEAGIQISDVECVIKNPIVDVSKTPSSIVPDVIKNAVIFALVGVVLACVALVVKMLVKMSEQYDTEIKTPKEKDNDGKEDENKAKE